MTAEGRPIGGGVDRRVEEYLRDVEQSLLQASVHEAELQEALETRTTIGQAIGLLMAHGALRADEAFQKLVAVSQNTNIRLREIARSYVDAWEDKLDRRGTAGRQRHFSGGQGNIRPGAQARPGKGRKE